MFSLQYMINKWIFIILFITALPTYAFDLSSLSGSAKLASSSYTNLDSGTAFILAADLPMPNVSKNFSIEAEFSKSITHPSTQVAFSKLELPYYSFGGYGVYNYPVNEKFTMHGKAGLSYVVIEAKITSRGLNFLDNFASYSEFDLSLGFGMTYAIQKNVKIVSEFTVLNTDIGHLSAGIQYGFDSF